MKGRLIDLTIGLDGVQRVTVAVLGDFRQQYDALKDVAVDVEIKKHRELRSKDANAYCWLLISKIAEAIQPPLSKDEVYVKISKGMGRVRPQKYATAKFQISAALLNTMRSLIGSLRMASLIFDSGSAAMNTTPKK